MSAPKEAYRRLSGRSFGLVSTASLWLGRDHLLVVTRMPGGEGYRRYFFRDIQAVAIRPNNRFVAMNVIFGVLSFFNFLVLLPLFGDRDLRPLLALGVPALVMWLALLVLNNVRGPTCETRFKTAVQYQPVSALGRRRRALAALEVLRPLILAAQQRNGPGTPSPAGAGSDAGI